MGDIAPLTLKSEVAAKYDLIKIAPGTYCFPGFGQIDLTKIDLKRADKLVATGFVWLVVKAPAAAPAAPPAPAVPVAKVAASPDAGVDGSKNPS